MKATYLLFLTLGLLTAYPSLAQTTNQTQQQEQESEDEDEDEDEEGIEDEENRKRRWQCSLAGGEYAVNLGNITSLSKHSYVLDGTLLVTEVTIDTTGTALARFYYIEPITKDTNFNSLARIQQRAKELRAKTQQRSGIKADEMAQKSYPTTTHARTIEFRIATESKLNALYRSVHKAWDTGKGRNFRMQ